MNAAAEERAAFARALTSTTPRVLVTPALIAINVIVFLLMMAAGADITGDDASALLRWGATYGPAVTAGDWWRIVSSMFVHAGFLHLFSKMFVLVSIGPVTERLYGQAAFFVLYFIAGAAGSIAGIYWHPVTNSVGASGAVFGVMGMVLAYAFRQRRALHSSILRSFARSIASSVVLNMVLGLALPMINVAAHVGGLVAGFLFGLLLARPLVPSPLMAQLSRSALAAVLGAALVAGSLFQLPRYDDWLGALAGFQAVERQTAVTLQRVISPRRTETRDATKTVTEDAGVTPAESAALINGDVLPPWRAARDRLAGLRLPRQEKQTANQLVQYMDARAEAWRLLSEAITTGDVTLAKQSREKLTEADRLNARLRGRGVRGHTRRGADASMMRLDQAIALQHALRRFAEVEQAALDTYSDALTRARRRKISESQFAAIIETRIVPPWREQYEVLRALQVPADLGLQRNQIVEAMRLRMEGWELMARGLRTRSTSLIEEADRRQDAATKMLNAPASPNP